MRGKSWIKSWMQWSAMGAVVVAMACGAVWAQEAAKPAPLTFAELKGRSFQFEVASIRPNTSGDQVMSWRSSPDNFQMTNVPLRSLVDSAYDITLDAALVELPKWAENDRYNLVAKVDEETSAIWKRLNREDKGKLIQMLEQNLLAERCQFKMHKEIRQLPAYELVVAKGGLKLKAAADDSKGGYSTRPGKIDAQGMEIGNLAGYLTSNLDRTVVDKTGLGEKQFTFTLKWTPDEQQGTAEAGPSIYAALEEQLGLKLVPTKAPVEIVVVDRMERPSEN
jgi:uncharacterized protein (TIGR03435 family)